MNRKPLYHIIPIDLGVERTKSKPYELGTQKDYIFILTCSGTAQMSISGGDFFPLKEGMQILLPPELKEIEITNETQIGKNLTLFLGTQKQCEVKTAGS